ncbi:MAG: GNAT family N-acetyltransferase [Tissierellia bacterium]|nr:GNAT family N-acetyltransferase [Tissierellia bacterium]
MIREAKKEDLAYLRNLSYILNEEMSILEPHYALAADGDLDELSFFIDDPNHVCFVAIEDKIVIGMILAELQETPKIPVLKEKSFVNIADFIIHPGFRNLGYGKKLIQAVEKWATEKDADFVSLSCLSKNKSAIEVYKKLSYGEYSVHFRKELQ